MFQNIKIIVALHKKYDLPGDPVYCPIHVGAAGKERIGCLSDDSGDNISLKNAGFCELTGLYWAWKNLECDYLGLVHYRRYFTVCSRFELWRAGKSKKAKLNCVLSDAEVRSILEHCDIVVPGKRRYYIETLYSHYSHSHYHEHLDVTRDIIAEKYPKYLPAFDKVMKQSYGHMFNMFIMSRQLSDKYCEWLFDILFELEKRIDLSDISAFQSRLYGRVSEIIFNVWLTYQVEKHAYRVQETRFFYMEPVKWRKKISAFLKAKFLHKKYESGF